MTVRDSGFSAGTEAPVSRAEEDRYGFEGVAAGLVRSILALNNDVSTVIGIEGKWGAGKTSLLRLLMNKLEDLKPDGTYVLHLAPWLTAHGTSPVDSLLLPVAAILREEEERRQPPPRNLWQKCQRRIRRGRNTGAALDMLNYLRQTSGRLAPLAEFAGNFVPGLGMAAKGMETLAKLDLSGRQQTASDLHASLDKKIRLLDLNFIVIIDDLDRLEPAQAVEVLRLVRSVADFSRFRYVMCYDRDVLAHAVQQHLGVSDGILYMQKIIQLSFSLPRPESFDLRREFRTGAAALFSAVNGCNMGAAAESDLAEAVDVYGEMMSTPREVNQTLNALRFRYAGLRDYVYFPDLCLLQLLRVVNPGLYEWAEQYLTERAVIATGDASISDGEMEKMSSELQTHLSGFHITRARHGWSLGRWLPGINGYKKEYSLFGQVPDEEKLTIERRLGSLVYWRYYFSFSAPQNVLPEQRILDIMLLAGTEPRMLENRLLESISSNGVSTRTWFEHIITRLTPRMTDDAPWEQLEGLLGFFFNSGDRVKKAFIERSAFFIMRDTGADVLVRQLISQMLKRDRERTLTTLASLFVKGKAIMWSADFMRDLLWQHGLAGDSPVSEHERLMTRLEVQTLRHALSCRLDSPAVKQTVMRHDRLLGYMYACRDIQGAEPVRRWIDEVSQSDSVFLELLLKLRSTVSSSDRGIYHKLDLSAVSVFFQDKGSIENRLNQIEATGRYQDQISEVKAAISLNRHF
ncbi:P-loop NTPase fold protein [Pantoea sp. SS70]|uniref:KAP family P-loop NTPase fold protein n=1 Tax=Pantoea sp. SS70 TaxID=3024247 RepID=UPI00245368FB|nr:P-loop NTPase fold protein [Pantoea sp. SS70]WGK60050.1 P-loop NTPase fold protein [Pantoea sp. SS70]